MNNTATSYRITEATKDIIREDMWKMIDHFVTECGVEGEALIDFISEMIEGERAIIADLAESN